MPKGATAAARKKVQQQKQLREDGDDKCTGRQVVAALVLGLGIGVSILQCIAFSVDLKTFQSQLISSSLASSVGLQLGLDSRDGPTIGLTVVHCKEDWSQMSWIEEIPSHWRLVVYETCGEHISKSSRPWINAGSEECTGYLQTMIEQYDNLPDINIFLQSDGLVGRGVHSKNYWLEHTPFKTIQDLMDATMAYSSTWDGSHFLHYGPKYLQLLNVNAKQNFLESHPREVLDIMQMPYQKIHEFDKLPEAQQDATRSYTRKGACFAVTPDRIRSRPVELYRKLQDSVYVALAQGGANAVRQRCCALEYLWHAVLGGPYYLPLNDTVDHLWQAQVNYYNGTWEEELKRQKEQQQPQ
ncbi:expressed unknown protein [Seminavis robusta]|uniref:Uncharacterized protein n=1 Tax=Seminavis robusta TaxID=568900 RepID=A0A9N8EUE7_9STRA|nr:expressed unknown protein [Seminavis robusta]|eukprot:Sro1792_g297860.1 n/a (355) ;mRNA; r:11146-12210